MQLLVSAVPLNDVAFQCCISPKCGETFSVEQVLTSCPKCGDLLDVRYEWDRIELPKKLSDFEQMWSRRHEPCRFSGV
ncbi:MAG: threonine synthase, partial [Pirellulaceae bacterium]